MPNGNRNKLIKKLIQSKKYEEFYNIRNFEVYVSFTISVLITLFLLWLYKTNVEVSFLNELIKNVTLYMASALIGLLGFTISGLAIMSSTMSTKVIKIIDSDKKMESLIKIFLSFYFMGFVIGFTIILFLLIYIMIYLPYNFSLFLISICSLISTYSLSFVIFYSVSLLGTCISMFQTNYNFSKGLEMQEASISIEKGYTKEEIQNSFNNYRISALTMVLIKGQTQNKEFKDILRHLIEVCEKDEKKELVLQYLEQLYKN